MKLWLAAGTLGTLVVAVVPSMWMNRVFPVTSALDQVASICLSILYGLAVGHLWARWALRRLRRGNCRGN